MSGCEVTSYRANEDEAHVLFSRLLIVGSLFVVVGKFVFSINHNKPRLVL